MEYMSNFLRRKTYRTCAVLISGAAMVMAATVVKENSDNNIVKNDAVNRQALESHLNTGDGDEETAPGCLSLERVYLGTVEEAQTDKPQLEAAVIPQVSVSGIKAESSWSDSSSEKNENQNSADKSDNNSENQQLSDNTENISEEITSENTQPESNETQNEAIKQALENPQDEVQEAAAPQENPQNEVQEEPAVVMGAAIKVTGEEYEALQRIVEAEAGNQDDIGRILVANVVLNRVKSDIYPDGIIENILKHSGDIYQFQPVKNGTYYTVTVSEKTKACVDRALAGEDYSDGALYFTRKTSDDSWFNTSLTFLFIHGAHYFYK